jgi:hypothetical protein
MAAATRGGTPTPAPTSRPSFWKKLRKWMYEKAWPFIKSFFIYACVAGGIWYIISMFAPLAFCQVRTWQQGFDNGALTTFMAPVTRWWGANVIPVVNGFHSLCGLSLVTAAVTKIIRWIKKKLFH